MALIFCLLLLLTGLGFFESVRHSRNRRRIPIRIHVNGSRGKSSVTRLIAAGLRAGGLRTLAKTTGSAACVIHSDGRESPVRRRGGPNIREQIRIMREAAGERVEALVLECMAVRPDLQRVCERGIVQATHGVITNVRPDHLEVMGPRLPDVALSLAGTVPHRGHLLTAERAFSDLLAARARRQGSTFTLCDPGTVTADQLAGFRYVEFPDNVSLALAVCQAAGVPRERALAGMREVTPDVGALTRRRLQVTGSDLEFINAFAANDPVSYLRIWERLHLADRPDEIVLVVNVRADRQRRSKDLAPLLGRQLRARHYVLIGEQTVVLADLLRRQRLEPDRILDLGGWSAAAVLKRLVVLSQPRATVVGIGNIAGVGRDLLALVSERGVAE